MKTVRSFANEETEANVYWQKLQQVYKLNKREAMAYTYYVWSSGVGAWPWGWDGQRSLSRSQSTRGSPPLPGNPVGLLIIGYFHPSKNASRSTPRQRCVVLWTCLVSPVNGAIIAKSSRSWSSPWLRGAAVCACASSAPGLRRGTAAALVELLLRNGDFLCVGGGSGSLLGFGFGLFFFFSFLCKMLFHR